MLDEARKNAGKLYRLNFPDEEPDEKGPSDDAS
jgi:hypothetical protein